MKTFLAVFVAVLISTLSFSQGSFNVTGHDPGSSRWEQIITPHFKLIYPVTFKENAQHIANGLEYFQTRAGNTLGLNTRKTFEDGLLHYSASGSSHLCPGLDGPAYHT
jgi:hypothetical protein